MHTDRPLYHVFTMTSASSPAEQLVHGNLTPVLCLTNLSIRPSQKSLITEILHSFPHSCKICIMINLEQLM